MGLVELIVVLAIVGVIWWLFTTYVPMPQPVKTIVTVVVVVVMIILLLQFVGIGGGFRVG